MKQIKQQHLTLTMLQIVSDVLRLNSVTKAGEANNMTQPAATYQLRRFEELLGTKLLLRLKTGKLAITPTGLKVQNTLQKFMEVGLETLLIHLNALKEANVPKDDSARKKLYIPVTEYRILKETIDALVDYELVLLNNDQSLKAEGVARLVGEDNALIAFNIRQVYDVISLSAYGVNYMLFSKAYNLENDISLFEETFVVYSRNDVLGHQLSSVI